MNTLLIEDDVVAQGIELVDGAHSGSVTTGAEDVCADAMSGFAADAPRVVEITDVTRIDDDCEGDDGQG